MLIERLIKKFKNFKTLKNNNKKIKVLNQNLHYKVLIFFFSFFNFFFFILLGGLRAQLYQRLTRGI